MSRNVSLETSDRQQRVQSILTSAAGHLEILQVVNALRMRSMKVVNLE